MGRKVLHKRRPVRMRYPYRTASLDSGGMACQMRQDGVIYDRWGKKLAVCHTSGHAGTVWSRIKRDLAKHPEWGSLQEEPYQTTLGGIMAWVREQREFYADLDEEQRAEVEKCGLIRG